MIQIRRSAIVRHTPAQMFALVNDIEAYPRRFNWCAGSQVLERTPHSILARLDLRIAGTTQSFTTRNSLDPPRRIDMKLFDGPFRELTGTWEFTALGDSGCRIGFALDFEYAGRMFAPLLRSGFERLADRMVDDFCAQADQGDG